MAHPADRSTLVLCPFWHDTTLQHYRLPSVTASITKSGGERTSDNIHCIEFHGRGESVSPLDQRHLDLRGSLGQQGAEPQLRKFCICAAMYPYSPRRGLLTDSLQFGLTVGASEVGPPQVRELSTRQTRDVVCCVASYAEGRGDTAERIVIQHHNM